RPEYSPRAFCAEGPQTNGCQGAKNFDYAGPGAPNRKGSSQRGGARDGGSPKPGDRAVAQPNRPALGKGSGGQRLSILLQTGQRTIDQCVRFARRTDVCPHWTSPGCRHGGRSGGSPSSRNVSCRVAARCGADWQTANLGHVVRPGGSSRG